VEKEKKRLSRVDYYLIMAKIASYRATCVKARHGCVLVNSESNRVVSIGYNGTPPGKPHCSDDDVGCLIADGHCIRTIHAEIQAISRLRGVFCSLTAYVTAMPCINCYKALVACNVTEINCIDLYVDSNRDKLVEFYGVPIYRHTVTSKYKEAWKTIEDLLGL